jgi:hypothetical protein
MKNAHIPRGARILILGIACLGLTGQVFAQSEVTPSEELNMQVRVLGVKFSSSTSGAKAKGGSSIEQPVEVVWSKNKSVWSRIFYGTQSTVDPAAIVLDTVIAKTDIVDFGARGYLSDWLPLYSTSSACTNLIVLKNGDRTPPQIANKKTGQMAGFIKPYLSNDLQTVKIGDGELLILVELDQTEPFAVGFDYQDLGMLVTFK